MNLWETIFRKDEERPSHAYLVGEEGPEVFLPDMPGRIVPIFREDTSSPMFRSDQLARFQESLKRPIPPRFSTDLSALKGFAPTAEALWERKRQEFGYGGEQGGKPPQFAEDLSAAKGFAATSDELWERKRKEFGFGGNQEEPIPLISMAEGGPVEPVLNNAAPPADPMGEILDLCVFSELAVERGQINPEIGQFVIQKLVDILKSIQGNFGAITDKTIPSGGDKNG